MHKKFVVGSILATWVLGMGGALWAAETKAPTTVKGEVLDMACYLDHGAKGEKHKGCAEKCIKM